MAKVVADERARGGSRGRPVLIVLGASLALLAAYMIGMVSWTGTTAPSNTQQPTSAASSSTR